MRFPGAVALLLFFAPGAHAESAPAAAVQDTSGAPVLFRPHVEPLPTFSAAHDNGYTFGARLGYHVYGGWHWRNNDRAAYDSAAIELAASRRLLETFWTRLDAGVSSGYYGGSHCEPDGPASCVTNRFSNFYVAVGPRATWKLPHGVFLFGEGGVGLHFARFAYSVSAGDPNFTQSGGGSTSKLIPQAQIGAGAGVYVRTLSFFASGNYISADATLPARTGSSGFFNGPIALGFGGTTVLFGADLRL